MVSNEYFNLYNELGEKYPESQIVYQTKSGRFRFQLIQTLLKERTGLTLDLGCNDGPFSSFIEEYVGLDIAIACLARFQKPRIWAIGEFLPFRSSMFERVILIETLEHIPSRDIVLSECWRVLRPHGELIVTVPGGNNPQRMTEIGRHAVRLGVRSGLHLDGCFSIDQMRELLDKNNFQNNEVSMIRRRCIAIARKK